MLTSLSHRRPLLHLCALLCVTLLTSSVCAQEGGGYQLKPSVVAGGGGTSTNGDLTLTGTVGQPVVGVSTSDSSTGGATYSLQGGFIPAAFDVVASNASPVNTLPAEQTIAEDTALVFSVAQGNRISVSDPDAGDGTLQVIVAVTNGVFTLSSTPADVAVTGNGSATVTLVGSLSAINAKLDGATYTPTPNYNGTASLTINTNDQGNTGAGGALSDTDSLALNVTPANDPPTAAHDNYMISENTALNTLAPGVLTNDADPDNATLNATLVANPTNGALTFNSDGSFTYTPHTGFSGDDTFTYTASDGAATSNTATVTITVNDIAAGEFSFSQSNFNVNEDTASATITILRTNGASGAVTVNYATGASTDANAATEGSDYTDTSGTLTFADGETAKSFTVTLSDDTFDEADETLRLSLDGATGGGTLGTQSAATLTIIDNDSQPTVQFSQPTYSVNEAAGTATITVTRSAGGSNPFTVNYSTGDATTGNSATAGADYTGITAGTLNFAAGEQSQTFTVTIFDDTSFEPNESLNLILSDAVGAGVGTQSTAVLTINDNDSEPSVQFGNATYVQGENNQTATITVIRSGNTSGSVSVQYATSNGTATAGSDYTAASGTLTFGDGETEKTFTITLNEDSLFEGDETINLTLSNTVGARIGTPNPAQLTITDNDGAPVVEFSSATYSVAEGTAEATITVTRTGGTNGGVTVNYATANNTASAAADYTATAGTLNFDAGETTKTFTILIADDTAVEGDETINLTLDSPAGGASLGTQSAATLTITDNDAPPACAADVTTQLTITRGSFSQNFATRRFRQTVTIRNTGGQSIAGPVALVLDNLSRNAALFNPEGRTGCAAPLGSPYVNVSAGSDNVLTPGETISVILEYTNSDTRQSITYTPRVLAGGGTN